MLLRVFTVLALSLVPVLAACNGDDAERASAILCNTAYRPSVGEAITDSGELRFEDEDAVQSAAYDRLELHAQYGAGRSDGERALRLWVTQAGEDAELLSQLFQLPDDAGPENQFAGGHGFTGLSYAYDPDSGAELQYWCEAE